MENAILYAKALRTNLTEIEDKGGVVSKDLARNRWPNGGAMMGRPIVKRKTTLLSFALATSAAMFGAVPKSNADIINVGGTSALITVTTNAKTPSPCTSSGLTSCQVVSFSGIQVSQVTSVNGLPPSDSTILNDAVSLPEFAVGWSGTASSIVFFPIEHGFSIFNPSQSPAPSLQGDVNWSILDAANGGYSLTASLSNMSATGSDQVFNDFANGYPGTAVLTFQFGGGGLPQFFANTKSNGTTSAYSSISGTLTSVPELSSGTGTTALALLLGGLVLIRGRRRTFSV